MQFIDLKSQYASIEDKVRQRIDGVLEHGQYILGPEVSELEKQLADYVGVDHCVTCGNGTDALQLALMALGIGPGDAVFTTSFTFFATAEVIALAGATPVFVDVDADTYNIDPEKLKCAIEDVLSDGKLKPAAIIAVDLFGLPANYSELEALAKHFDMPLIEDGAQGFGGEISGRKACSFGEISTTSFFPAKPLGCYGDGGALFTNDAQLAELFRSLRVHGKGRDKYDNVRIGLNSRLDTLQAAILLEKLAVFPREVELRNEVARRYQELLSDAFVLPQVPKGYLSSWAQYTIRPRAKVDRQVYMDALKAEGIPSAVYYGKSMHRQQALKDHCIVGDVSLCEDYESQVFSLPMHPYLTEEEQQRVAAVLNSVDG